MRALAQIRDSVQPGQVYDVIDHRATQPGNGGGPQRRTVLSASRSAFVLSGTDLPDGTPVPWPRARQVEQDPDGTLRLYGQDQTGKFLWLTLVPVPVCTRCGGSDAAGAGDVIGKIAGLLRKPDSDETTLDQIADVVRAAGWGDGIGLSARELSDVIDPPNPGLFYLDEDSAAEWLAEDSGDPAPAGDDNSLPAVADDWHPADDAHSAAVTRLLDLAHDAGVITSPAGWRIAYEYDADTDGEGYRWFLSSDDAQWPLTLAGPFETDWPEGRGAVAALGLLRTAVSTANGLLADLARYTTTSEPAPLPPGAGPARFVLDETRAAAWASQAITQHDHGSEHEDETLPDIGAGYRAAWDVDGTDTCRLIRVALFTGVIADTWRGPDALDVPSLAWEYVNDGDGACRWLLYGGAGDPILASELQGMASLAIGGDDSGAGQALAVLRAALRAGNALAGERAALGLGGNAPHA